MELETDRGWMESAKSKKTIHNWRINGRMMRKSRKSRRLNNCIINRRNGTRLGRGGGGGTSGTARPLYCRVKRTCMPSLPTDYSITIIFNAGN